MCGSPSPPVTPPTPMPKPQAALPVPTIDEARQNRMKQDQAISRRGRAADILTGPEGLTAPATTGTKKLLGN